MTLAGALSEHEDALSASLHAVYGVRLADPGMGALELADRVAHLPPGCALWRATGGDLAWSAEMHMLSEIEYGVRVVGWLQSEDGRNNRNRPERITPPKPAHLVQAEAARESAKAEAWRRRQERTSS